MSNLFKTQKIEEIKFMKSNEEELNTLEFNNEEISKYINDDKLLSYDELMELSNKASTYKTDRMNIFKKQIGNNLVVVNENIYLYCNQLRIYLKSTMPPSEFLLSYLLILKEKSHKKLKYNEKKLLPINKVNDFENPKDINLLINYMKKENNYFSDPKLDEIHFMNGYINLKSGCIYERTQKDKMTYCVMREYKTPSEKGLLTMIKFINKIYPQENDRDNILSMYGDAMTGRSPEKQYSLFLLGLGGSGKSIILNLLKICFQDYVFQLKEDTLSIYNNKQDRILNMFIYKKYVRIAFINELVGKINDSVFKQLAEGKIQTTTLFQEGMNDVILNSLMVFMSNEFPNIKMDSGVSRRLRGLQHKSKFVENKNDVNEKENIYLRDEKFLKTFSEDEDLINALVYIILGYSKEIYENVKYPISENMIETKETIEDSNSVINKFIELYIIDTKKEKDKIRSEDLYSFFKLKYPKSLLTENQLKTGLNEKGIKYNRNLSFKIGQKTIRGGYNCIKLNDDTNLYEDENSLDEGINYEFGKDNEKDKIINKQLQEIEELKIKLKILEEKILEEKIKPIVEEKKPIVEEEKPKIEKPKKETKTKKKAEEEKPKKETKSKKDNNDGFTIGVNEQVFNFNDLCNF
jgi:hypothetical protein